MVIHSYLTSGFYKWAELFIKSYRLYHDEKIFLSTRGLDTQQIQKLQSLPDVTVSNKELDVKMIANRAKLPVKKILKLKKHIENGAVTKQTFIWKQAISVEDRYRNSILEAMDEYPEEDFLVHFDIDMYIRKPLNDLFRIIKKNDITIKFRLKSKINRKVMGGLIGFKISEKTRIFMERWIYYIDSKPLYQKPLGYGQTSFYLTYCDFKNDLSWGNVPSSFISPRFQETDAIWSGNTKDGKTKNFSVCMNDFQKRRFYETRKKLC